jgi:hypothetical protein
VTTPISIVEWFYNFYQETDKPGKKKAKTSEQHQDGQPDAQRPIECLLRPGDMIFIPNGWWHTVHTSTTILPSLLARSHDTTRTRHAHDQRHDRRHDTTRQVLNLEESVAVTQNYVGRHNVKNVLEFLRRKENQTLFNELMAKLRERQPQVLAEIEAAWAKEEQDRREREKKREESCFWSKLKTAPAAPDATVAPSTTDTSAATGGGGFSFSFNFN